MWTKTGEMAGSQWRQGEGDNREAREERLMMKGEGGGEDEISGFIVMWRERSTHGRWRVQAGQRGGHAARP